MRWRTFTAQQQQVEERLRSDLRSRLWKKTLTQILFSVSSSMKVKKMRTRNAPTKVKSSHLISRKMCFYDHVVVHMLSAGESQGLISHLQWSFKGLNTLTRSTLLLLLLFYWWCDCKCVSPDWESSQKKKVWWLFAASFCFQSVPLSSFSNQLSHVSSGSFSKELVGFQRACWMNFCLLVGQTAVLCCWDRNDGTAERGCCVSVGLFHFNNQWIIVFLLWPLRVYNVNEKNRKSSLWLSVNLHVVFLYLHHVCYTNLSVCIKLIESDSDSCLTFTVMIHTTYINLVMPCVLHTVTVCHGTAVWIHSVCIGLYRSCYLWEFDCFIGPVQSHDLFSWFVFISQVPQVRTWVETW